LAFIHNPSTVTEETRQTADVSEIVARLVTTGKMSDDTIAPRALKTALGISSDNIGEDDNAQVPLGRSSLESFFSPSDKAAKTYKDYAKMSKLIAREFGFAPGESGIVINGRIIGPIERGRFTAADFDALVEFELKKRTEAALESIENSCSWVTLLGR
jgi:UDP-glucose:glycoprotein glucosyltransferase